MIFVNDQDHLQEVLSLSKEIRIIPRGQRHDRQKRDAYYLEILKQVESKLHDYTTGSSLTESIAHLLKETMQLEVTAEQILRKKPADKGELQHKAVFPILDPEKKEEVLIVKAYASPYKEFLSELSGAELLDSLDLTHTTFPLIHAVGKAKLNERHFLFLVEAVADGVPIASLFRPAVRKKGEKRKAAFEELLEAMRAVGHSLGELHTKYLDKPRHFSRGAILDLEEMARKAASKLTGKPREFFKIELIKTYGTDLAKRLLDEEIRYGFVHGDFTFTNFRYDQKNKSIVMIDLPILHRSVDRAGKPRGMPGADTCKVASCLAWYLKHLKPEKISLLEEAFYEGYEAEGGEKPSVSVQEYYHMMHRLSSFVNTTKKRTLKNFLPEGHPDYEKMEESVDK